MRSRTALARRVLAALLGAGAAGLKALLYGAGERTGGRLFFLLDQRRRECERWIALGLRRTNCTWSLPPVLRSNEAAVFGSDYVERHRQWQDTLDAEQVFDEVFGPAGDSVMRS